MIVSGPLHTLHTQTTARLLYLLIDNIVSVVEHVAQVVSGPLHTLHTQITARLLYLLIEIIVIDIL